MSPPLLPHEEEKRLNKSKTIQIKKAGFITCLFLCVAFKPQAQNDWVLSPQLSEAYTFTLNLQIDESRKSISDPTSAEQIYIASLGDVLELLLTEDEVKFEKHEDVYESRLNKLEGAGSTASALFTIAELRLQWAFVYLKFGHEFDAAWNIRQAYFSMQECKKKFPLYLPIKKTSGVLEVMLGAVPEKYQWVINMLGMQGSVEKGLQELEEVKSKSSPLHMEATLLYYLIQGYILQRTEIAVSGLHDDLSANEENQLVVFFRAALAIKNSQSEKALSSLIKLEENKTGLPIAYAHYQLGEVYLHKGEYESAIRCYQKFLKEYHGLNYIKDARYKTGICYWLTGNTSEAVKHFDQAKESGKEATEADKYAARSLADNSFPNIKLSKIRYATDGGYYEEAKRIVSSVEDRDLATSKEKIEFIYRKARLFDKSGSTNEAAKLYLETISLQKEESWYFAPNSCLQLGYIAINKNNLKEAKQYFEKALSYKKHEYKNSIDSKAKSALAQLDKK